MTYILTLSNIGALKLEIATNVSQHFSITTYLASVNCVQFRTVPSVETTVKHALNVFQDIF